MDKHRGVRNIRLLNTSAFIGNLFLDRAIWIIYLTEQGFSLFQIGLLQSILHITMFLFEIPTGVVADLAGRRTSLLIGRTLNVLYLLGMMFVSNFWQAAGCFFVYGLGLTFVSGAEEALLYDSVKDEGEAEDGAATRYLGRYAALVTLSLAVAMLAGGVLKSISWGVVYGLAACLQAVAVCCCFLLADTPAEARPAPQRLSNHLRETFMFFRSNRTGRLIMMGTALYVGMVSTYYMFSQDLFHRMGFSVALVSALFALESLIAAGVSANAHRVESRFGTKKALLYALALSLALFPVVGWQAQVTGISAFYAINITYGLIYPLTSSVVNKEVPSAQRASLLSVMSFSTSAVMFAIFPLIGYLADLVQINAVLSTLGFVSMLICLATVLRFYSAVSGTPEGDGPITSRSEISL